ncbi:hypothetical protein TW65_08951 [Stemphylium lycopersici]|nr:hypothetical protein TW65_08951 [Stemphylium lycopersici]
MYKRIDCETSPSPRPGKAHTTSTGVLSSIYPRKPSVKEPQRKLTPPKFMSSEELSTPSCGGPPLSNIMPRIRHVTTVPPFRSQQKTVSPVFTPSITSPAGDTIGQLRVVRPFDRQPIRQTTASPRFTSKESLGRTYGSWNLVISEGSSSSISSARWPGGKDQSIVASQLEGVEKCEPVPDLTLHPAVPLAKHRRQSNAAPGIVASPPEVIQEYRQKVAPPVIPVKKPKKLVQYPPEQQYPSAPAYPQRDVPSWTKPDTHTPPLKPGAESPPQKRGWFGGGSKSKGRPWLIQKHPAKRESQLHYDNEPHHGYQPLESSSYAVPRAPKLPEGALQGEGVHTDQIRREKDRRKPIVNSNGKGDCHSRKIPVTTHKNGYYPTIDPIVQNGRHQVAPPQLSSVSKDVFSYSEPVPVGIRTDDVPPNITAPWEDHAHTRVTSRYAVTSDDTTRQPPLRHQSKADIRQYEEHQVPNNQKKDSALFQTSLSQRGLQDHEKSPRLHRTRENESTPRPVRQYAYTNQERKGSEPKRGAASPKDRVQAQTQNEAHHIPQKEGPSDAKEPEYKASRKPDSCVRPLESVKTTVPMLQRRFHEPKRLERTEGATIRTNDSPRITNSDSPMDCTQAIA